MKNMNTTSKPWLTPDETVEALEVMKASAECMRNTVEFGSLRKELRNKLLDHVRRLDQCVAMFHRDIVDESLMLGIEDMAREKKTGVIVEMMEALEKHVSEFNRRKK